MAPIMSAPLVSCSSLLHMTYLLSILVGPLEKGINFLSGHFFFLLTRGTLFNMMILPIHSLTPAAPLLHSRPMPGSAGRGLSFRFSEAQSKPGEGDGG